MIETEVVAIGSGAEIYDDELIASYLDNAAAMLQFMERHSEVRFKPFPLADLRMPLPQLMLFGSMQIEGADIHPMRHALKTWAGFKHTAKVMRRFVRDKIRYGRGTRLVNGLSITTAHSIADRTFLRTYGLDLARPAPFSPAALIRAGYLIEAPTLDELVRRIGVAPTRLQVTVIEFNESATRGEDPEFGKGTDAHSRFRGGQTHRPNPSIAPIGDGPYYAIAIHPDDLSTVGGLETNGRAQVLDAAGWPIPGLYAAGLDMNSMMRGRYPGGGSSIGPAMTFGYTAARDMAKASTKVDPRQLAENH